MRNDILSRYPTDVIFAVHVADLSNAELLAWATTMEALEEPDVVY